MSKSKQSKTNEAEERVIIIVEKALDESVKDIQDDEERKKLRQQLLLNSENNRKYALIHMDTTMTEWHFFGRKKKLYGYIWDELKKL